MTVSSSSEPRRNILEDSYDLSRTSNIEHYDPVITYRPGKLQTVPDALSRRPGVNLEDPRWIQIDFI